jgi:integrase
MGGHVRARKSVVIEPRDQNRILAALERWAETGDFVALRTRAFVYLLWDGALRTKAAAWLDADEVVKDPAASRIHVLQEVTQRACEGNNHRERTFLLSDRVRGAVAEYLKLARGEGWLANGNRLEGPLWISTHHRGTQQRMSQRTALQAWHTFLEAVDVSREYQLDDVVLTGRVAFLQAAKGSTDVMSRHAGISPKWGGSYREHLFKSPSSTARDVISALNKQQKRKQS